MGGRAVITYASRNLFDDHFTKRANLLLSESQITSLISFK